MLLILLLLSAVVEYSVQRYKNYFIYAPIQKKIFLKGRILRSFEVLMPHQSVIMPPIYTFMKVKYVKSALTSQGRKHTGPLFYRLRFKLMIIKEWQVPRFRGACFFMGISFDNILKKSCEKVWRFGEDCVILQCLKKKRA